MELVPPSRDEVLPLPEAQLNEVQCKVPWHNLCAVIQSVHELGIETNSGK